MDIARDPDRRSRPPPRALHDLVPPLSARAPRRNHAVDGTRLIMKLPRREFLQLAAGAAAVPAATRIASAQVRRTYPTRGVRIIVGFPAGAGADIAARLLGQWLSERLGQPFINETLYDKLSFNLIGDIAPVAGIFRGPFVMLVNPSFPAKTLAEFIAYAKANPGKINMASAGIGTAPHLAGELFKGMTGVDMVHVPYRGA